MNKKFHAGLLSVLVCAAIGSVASCTKDYGEDIAQLQSEVSTLQSTVNSLQSQIAAGSVITAVTPTNDGVTVTLSNGKSFTLTNGKDGAKGDKGSKGDSGDDGTNCTAQSVKNAAGLEGLEVTCGETVVDTIWNGKDGEAGESGDDGVGCSLKDDGDGTVTVTCGDGDDATTATLYKAVCGTKPYDPLKSFCSEGELYSCNDKPFDPKKHYCLKVTRDETDIYSVEDLLTDPRDNQVYKIVEICNNETSTCQTWMAENLNYSVNPNVQSWCGGGSGATEGDCSVYGRLYTWAAAVGKSEDECGYDHECDLSDAKNEKGEVRGVCPEGWHLPSNVEWNALFTAVGDTSYAGQKLKADSDLWNEGTSNDDSFGFAVLPAGSRNLNGSFDDEGDDAYFWSSTESSIRSADGWDFDYDGDYVYDGWYFKYLGFSVRCLRD